jgi:1-acyl-sn-glycerol-3-phosphate acyltransferase
VRFLARHDVWTNPVAGPLMTAMRHVPVDRDAPAAAYLRARALLGEGEAVGIFPEAGVSTSYTVRALMPGAVALARETGAPIVPMAIWGPQRILTAKRPVDLRRGRPVSLLVGPPSYVGRGDDVREGTARLGVRLQGLLDDLQARPVHAARPGEHPPWLPAHLGGTAPTPEQARPLESVPSSAVPPSWVSGAG